ncbi:MAG: efflux RND transporter periplasmic adaptor subunit [Proteiniphilum sp.]|nr:efflux RND transporter periplasmic adaptor subunit [Proteiniphilum sp.]
MKTVTHLFYCCITLFLIHACGHRQEPTEPASGLIEITSRQFIADSMQLGGVEPKIFERTVRCSGSIVPRPNGIATVNAPVSGIIKNLYCYNGQPVRKDQSLLEITGNEVIDMQEQFAEASASYQRLKNEYERTQSLYADKIISEKDFIRAESEYRTSLAKYNGLKMKMTAMGFSVTAIERGTFYASYMIKTPIPGIISNLDAHIGSYIDAQSELLEVIDPNLFQLKLAVFASDLASLKEGQTVRFQTADDAGSCMATLRSIGVALDDQTKTADCYASITDRKSVNRIANGFVEAEIITSTDSVSALPDEAIMKTDKGHVVLVLDRQDNDTWYFMPVEVIVGRKHNGYSEIVADSISEKVLIRGAYHVNIP